ncbi:MAG: alkaline phosphatase family protein [Thermoleophilia bacterium]
MSKVAIFGLDGGTYRVIDYLVGRNRMPNFAGFMAAGSRTTLMSTTPPITPAAWSSFYTGTNPGKAGVVGFFKWHPGSYKLDPINAGAVHGEPIWSLAGSRGKRVCVYNVPVSYPAAPVNGILIAGMDAPRFDDQAIYPLDKKKDLLEAVPDFAIHPTIDAKYLIAHHADPVGEAIRILNAHLRMELATARFLMKQEDWDLFVAVFRSTDVFQHIFWSSVELVINEEGEADATDSRKAEAVFSCYEELDCELGEIMSGWGRDRNLILMSDHGFGGLEKEVCLNRVLENAGLLKFHSRTVRSRSKQYLVEKLKTHLPERTRKKIKHGLGQERNDDKWLRFVDTLVADIDWSQTRLCSVAQFGTFYANLRGRYPLGIVNGEKDLAAVLTEAEAALRELCDPEDGRPVVTQFFRKEELYHGPMMSEMPDLVAVLRDYAYIGLPGTAAELLGDGIVRHPRTDYKDLTFSGTHRQQGILMLHGPNIANNRLGVAQMVDVAPTVMNLLDLPPLECWDGKVLAAALIGGSRQVNETGYQTVRGKRPVEQVYSEEDEEAVRRRLADLGYL